MNLARHLDVVVITRPRSQAAIQEALSRLPAPHPRFVYFDFPSPLRTQRKLGLGLRLHYVAWQCAVRWRFRQLIAKVDLIHHVTFNSFRLPGCWWFCRPPVVLGPLGAGQVCPWRFLPLFGRRSVLEALRTLSVMAMRFNPLLWLSFGSAARILVANRDTESRIPAVFRARTTRLLETGIQAADWDGAIPAGQGPGSRFVWVGTLEKWKGGSLALRALAAARGKNPALELTLVGEGSEAPALRALAQELGLSDQVRWLGRVPHAAMRALLGQFDALLFTSIRDTSGNVVLEAMAAGLPVVVLAHQGSAEITTPETAVQVEPTTIAATVAALADALLLLSSSAPLRLRLGQAGRQRVFKTYDWRKKAATMHQLYQEVWTARTPPQPNGRQSAVRKREWRSALPDEASLQQ